MKKAITLMRKKYMKKSMFSIKIKLSKEIFVLL